MFKGSFYLIIFTLGLYGCSTTNIEKQYTNINTNAPLEPTYYHVNIQSHDGIKIRATVYQPKLTSHQTAPLVIHTHPFILKRVSSPHSLMTTFFLPSQAAIKAWEEGYWVISYDQRGFGGSGGKVNLMNPELEVSDVSTIIDWGSEIFTKIIATK